VVPLSPRRATDDRVRRGHPAGWRGRDVPCLRERCCFRLLLLLRMLLGLLLLGCRREGQGRGGIVLRLLVGRCVRMELRRVREVKCALEVDAELLESTLLMPTSVLAAVALRIAVVGSLPLAGDRLEIDLAF
jgi:hypothetical protein